MDWDDLVANPWQHSAGISELEARALGQVASRISNSRPVTGLVFLTLCDNMAVVLSVERRRARDFRLLTQIRRISAQCLARNFKFRDRWIPSELNSAGKGSRLSEFNRFGISITDSTPNI